MKLLVNSTCFVEIDDEDVSIYLSNTWREQKNSKETTSYVMSSTGGILLHRLIMKVTDSLIQVDHIDGNGLNNCKSNLRTVNNRINAQNNHKRRAGSTSSKYVGVTKSYDSWRVRVWTKQAGHICLGSYKSEEFAARVYDTYMKKHFPPELRGTLNFE